MIEIGERSTLSSKASSLPDALHWIHNCFTLRQIPVHLLSSVTTILVWFKNKIIVQQWEQSEWRPKAHEWSEQRQQGWDTTDRGGTRQMKDEHREGITMKLWFKDERMNKGAMKVWTGRDKLSDGEVEKGDEPMMDEAEVMPWGGDGEWWRERMFSNYFTVRLSAEGSAYSKPSELKHNVTSAPKFPLGSSDLLA